MSTWRQFFKDQGFTSKQRGSASSKWLSIIQSDKKKMEQWVCDKEERINYWKELESLETYVEEIKGFVSKDKVAVAAKHTSDVAAHLKSRTTSNTNGMPSRIPAAIQKGVASLSSVSSTHLQPILTTPKSKSKRKSQATVAQLQEPWKELVEVALALQHGRSVDIPDKRDISHLSATRQRLYMFALDNLRAFQCDRQQIISKKDASVALSCTVNLSCDDLHGYFEDEFLTRAAGAYNLPTLESRTRRVLESLQKLLPRHDVRFVLEEVRILKGQYQKEQRAGDAVPEHWEAILDIIEHVCRLVLKPSFGSHASEADIVAEWKAILYMLLMTSDVFMRSGECVSDSTKSAKSMLDEEYGEFGTFGRKVDLTFHAHGLELANLEFKVAKASQLDIEVQNRKNIRLNRVIMESQYAACEVKSTVLFLDFQGWHGSLFALYPFEDIFICKYLGSVELPQSSSGLKRFLQGSTLDLLYVFAEHLITMAEVLRHSQEEKQDSISRKRHEKIFNHRSTPSTPPQEERRISSNIFLTPTKHK